MFVHIPLQLVKPGGHIVPPPRHVPSAHTCPVMQRVPHAPQLLASTCVFVHTPPQLVVNGGHIPLIPRHAPKRHTCPVMQSG